MTDWQHTLPPYGVPVEIFNHYGQVRRGINDGAYMRLTDCIWPWQNAIYPTEDVIAWRLLESPDAKLSPSPVV